MARSLALSPVSEASSASAAGQLFRPAKAPHGTISVAKTKRRLALAPKRVRESLALYPRFLEAKFDQQSRTAQVIIADQGTGNARDAHYYGADTILAAAKDRVFESAQAYADHPSLDEDINRPERSVRDLIGYYYDTHVTYSKRADGTTVPALAATLKIQDGADWAMGLIKEAVAYQKRFPDKTYIGISINADGDVAPATIDGAHVNYVHRITKVFSADMVTKPARGGKFLALVESESGPRLSKGVGMKGNLKEAATRLQAQKASGQIDEADFDLIIGGLLEADDSKKKDDGDGDNDSLEEARSNFAKTLNEADTKKWAAMSEAEQDTWTKSAREADKATIASKDPNPEDDEDAADAAHARTKPPKHMESVRESDVAKQFPSLYAAALREAQSTVGSTVADLQRENSELRASAALRESLDIANRKIQESSLPAEAGEVLMSQLLGKMPNEMDALIEAQVNYLKRINYDGGKRVMGNGARSIGLRESASTNSSAIFAGMEG